MTTFCRVVCVHDGGWHVYWAARGMLGSGAQELAIHRAARIILITGSDEFFKTLQQLVETLEQSQRQNPLSVDLLVSTAKRYLAKLEHRIQLDELFAQETDRVLDQLNGETFSAQGQWGQESFRARVRQYEWLCRNSAAEAANGR